MQDYYLLLLFLAGVAAGFINTMAGGGSLLTLPMLIFLGLPSAMANGTNRVALLAQNITAVAGFRQKGYFDFKYGMLLGLPAMLGSLLGARLAVNLPDALFNRILAIVMLIVLFVILFEPHKRFINYDGKTSRYKKIITVVLFFFLGIYGGFIQAGTGFIIIAGLSVLTGMSLVKINSLKVFVVGLYMATSLAVFFFSGNVNWGIGLILAAGNSTGAWLGSAFAVAKGDKWIKVVLFVAVVAMALRLLFNSM